MHRHLAHLPFAGPGVVARPGEHVPVTDFPYHDFYPQKAKTLQIDIQPTQIGKRHPVDAALVGHAGPTLATLVSLVNADRSVDFLRAMQDEMEKWLGQAADQERSDAVPIHPPRVMHELARAAPADSIFVSDTGTVTAWSARHLRLEPR
jgi:pyruvate oxidase